MKRQPKWGDFHRLVHEAWTETDLALLRQDRIDKEIDKQRLAKKAKRKDSKTLCDIPKDT